jgi:2-(1,2-epoxy-1,2-dihydrophenyl)acetyl-CoA isomerase
VDLSSDQAIRDTVSPATVLMERSGAVAIITLNRPERLNSFTVEMHAALRRALSEAEQDAAIRVIVLTGAGRGFCAGQDLSDRAVAPGGVKPDLGESVETKYNPLVRAMRACPKPILVAVNGVAAGAGASVALHGDIVLAAKSARFIQSFVKIGLLPDTGGTWTLTNLLGEQRAKAIAMTGGQLSAEKAEGWGLIYRAVDDDVLMSETMALANEIAAQPPLALAAIKAAVHRAATATLDNQLDYERDEMQRLGFTADYAEGVAAFMEKRPAVFTGKA